MKKPIRRTKCDRSQKCGGGKTDERNLHSLAARIETVYAFARANRRVARPAAAVSARLGLRSRPCFSASRQSQIYSVRRARRDRHEHYFYIYLIRHRIVVVSSIRLTTRTVDLSRAKQ